jgi:cell division septal protein FtsQ
VQSSKNRERDFKQGRAGVFIAAGIVFTVLFIGVVFTVVQLVLKSAGD